MLLRAPLYLFLLTLSVPLLAKNCPKSGVIEAYVEFHKTVLLNDMKKTAKLIDPEMDSKFKNGIMGLKDNLYSKHKGLKKMLSYRVYCLNQVDYTSINIKVEHKNSKLKMFNVSMVLVDGKWLWRYDEPLGSIVAKWSDERHAPHVPYLPIPKHLMYDQ